MTNKKLKTVKKFDTQRKYLKIDTRIGLQKVKKKKWCKENQKKKSDPIERGPILSLQPITLFCHVQFTF